MLFLLVSPLKPHAEPALGNMAADGLGGAGARSYPGCTLGIPQPGFPGLSEQPGLQWVGSRLTPRRLHRARLTPTHSTRLTHSTAENRSLAGVSILLVASELHTPAFSATIFNSHASH